jgi:hypothetical protein
LVWMEQWSWKPLWNRNSVISEILAQVLIRYLGRIYEAQLIFSVGWNKREHLLIYKTCFINFAQNLEKPKHHIGIKTYRYTLFGFGLHQPEEGLSKSGNRRSDASELWEADWRGHNSVSRLIDYRVFISRSYFSSNVYKSCVLLILLKLLFFKQSISFLYPVQSISSKCLVNATNKTSSKSTSATKFSASIIVFLGIMMVSINCIFSVTLVSISAIHSIGFCVIFAILS